MEVLGINGATVAVWLLFMLRSLSFVFVAPLLSARFIPLQFRILFSVLLSVIALTAFPPAGAPPMDSAAFAAAAVSELLLGLSLGFIAGLIFVAFQMAGQLVGYQMGFSIVNVLDPHSQQQVSLISDFFFVAAMLSFLGLNLHHDMLGVWYESCRIAPPGGFTLLAPSFAQSVSLMDNVVLLGLKISMPLVSFLLLTDLALGILARIVPQLNVFLVGISAKAAIGLFILGLLVLQFDPAVRSGSRIFFDEAGRLLLRAGQPEPAERGGGPP